jgi:hypothetical protein
MLNWDGINQLGYLYILCSALCHFTLQDHFIMLIGTWRTTQETVQPQELNGRWSGPSN